MDDIKKLNDVDVVLENEKKTSANMRAISFLIYSKL